jgi:hypothetical protein
MGPDKSCDPCQVGHKAKPQSAERFCHVGITDAGLPGFLREIMS